jgi:hypothetical protein
MSYYFNKIVALPFHEAVERVKAERRTSLTFRPAYL